MSVADSMYAHTPNHRGAWHSLSQHLHEVACLTSRMAEDFGASQVGYILGLLHDTGKATARFQEYLVHQARGSRFGKIPHSPYPAAILYERPGQDTNHPRYELLLPLAGHHTGLDEPGSLSARLLNACTSARREIAETEAYIRSILSRYDRDITYTPEPCKDVLSYEFRIRMLFSCLVDADRLDTERHFSSPEDDMNDQAPPKYDLERLWSSFLRDQHRLMLKVAPSPLNRLRREIYQRCLGAAPTPPGFFRLRVPTGGGKTRSTLAFALKHAMMNDLRRIVFAIPYTSIIDQTVTVFRSILGQQYVLEHHSQMEIKDGEEQDRCSVLQRSAVENWDAPIIVTTTVQLLESLLSNSPTRCRRIHNLARSVIVVDEAQTIPAELLVPTIDAFRLLIDQCNSTVVFSTATQPALDTMLDGVPAPLLDGSEIVPDFERYFALMKRVQYDVDVEPLSFDRLAQRVRHEHQALVILNTRKDARRLIAYLRDVGSLYHLSTLLCSAHRRKILAEVKQRLRSGERVILVTTQVVECGVDLDFPTVYRVVGPLDRIVQAACRCNREGRLSRGRVHIFDLREGAAPRGPYKTGLEKAKMIMGTSADLDLHSPSLYEKYFDMLHQAVDLDMHHIQDKRRVFDYPSVAASYRLIRDNTCPIVVPYGDSDNAVTAWLRNPCKSAWQRLQPYLVSLYEREVRGFETEGLVEQISQGVWRWNGSYDPLIGVKESNLDPTDLIV